MAALRGLVLAFLMLSAAGPAFAAPPVAAAPKPHRSARFQPEPAARANCAPRSPLDAGDALRKDPPGLLGRGVLVCLPCPDPGQSPQDTLS